MANGEGRRSNLLDGAQDGAFKASSVLDNVKPTGLGYGSTDQDRLLVGSGNQKLATKNGTSASTWEKRQRGWLDSPYRTFG
jgi:hypothetical protein